MKADFPNTWLPLFQSSPRCLHCRQNVKRIKVYSPTHGSYSVSKLIFSESINWSCPSFTLRRWSSSSFNYLLLTPPPAGCDSAVSCCELLAMPCWVVWKSAHASQPSPSKTKTKQHTYSPRLTGGLAHLPQFTCVIYVICTSTWSHLCGFLWLLYWAN